MSSIARILDVNANRAREALRVMEDAARFALDDAMLCSELKSLRHDLQNALNRLPPGWLEANRDIEGDVGTAISTASEMKRCGLIDVVVAAGKRLTEALRVIEEAGKTIDEQLAQMIEQIRYRAYGIESQLQLRLGTGRAPQWRLCLLLTKSLCKRPWRDVLHAAIDGGVDCVQVREKEMDGGDFVEHVREVIEIAKSAPTPQTAIVIVNDRVDVAQAAGADGVHVGQNDLSVHDVRRIAGRNLIVGMSTHDVDEARNAVEAGADYCGVGAMFATLRKPERVPSGPAFLAEYVQRYPQTTHLAIGGISSANIHELVKVGVRGVAVSTAICCADDPGAVAASICGAIEKSEKMRAAARVW